MPSERSGGGVYLSIYVVDGLVGTPIHGPTTVAGVSNRYGMTPRICSHSSPPLPHALANVDTRHKGCPAQFIDPFQLVSVLCYSRLILRLSAPVAYTHTHAHPHCSTDSQQRHAILSVDHTHSSLPYTHRHTHTPTVHKLTDAGFFSVLCVESVAYIEKGTRELALVVATASGLLRVTS